MLYAKHESNRPGCLYTVIAKDLKTARGLRKRVLHGSWPLGRWTIYRCAEQDWYKENGHELVGVFDKTLGGVIFG